MCKMVALPLGAGVLLLLVLLAGAPKAAAELPSELSLQGMTGLLNTPNALVTVSGRVDLGYSNQVESRWRSTKVPRQDNYSVSFGLLPFFEAGARLTEAPHAVRDLSANAKLQFPYHRPGWPQLALGIQDVGGGTPHFRTSYLVASQEFFARLRLSLGYGIGPDRLDGLFGGGELQLRSWLQLVGDYDTRDSAVGLRVKTPVNLLPWGVQLGVTGKSQMGAQHNDSLAFTLSLPLGRDPGAEACPTASLREAPDPAPVAALPPGPTTPGRAPDWPDEPTWARLQARLVAQGFEEVRLGLGAGRTLLIEFENSRFNRNEADALGLALGLALESPPAGLDTFTVRLLNGGLAVVELQGPVAPFRRFFARSECPGPAELSYLRSQLRVFVAPRVVSAGEDWFSGAGNPRLFHAALVLAPGLATGVGTEFGAFDYRLSLRPDTYLQLWPGASFRLLFDLPLSWSDDYEAGGTFNRHGDNNPALERILFNQAWHPAGGWLTLFSTGQYRRELQGSTNETIWSTADGRHQLRFRGGIFEAEDGGHVSLLGGYRYDWAALDLQFEGTAGRFYDGDRGYMLEVRRYFGDTAVGFFYIDTDYRIGGIRLSLPLTPRSDQAPTPWQVRGPAQWDYHLQSTLTDQWAGNNLVFDSGILPETEYTLHRAFLNRDRLGQDYLRLRLLRMFEAYRHYGLQAN